MKMKNLGRVSDYFLEVTELEGTKELIRNDGDIYASRGGVLYHLRDKSIKEGIVKLIDKRLAEIENEIKDF